MKKMVAFVTALALVFTNIPAHLNVGTGMAAETVYAADAIAINSEEDLIAIQENPNGNYYLAKDITIKGNLNLFSGYFDVGDAHNDSHFTGTLDGKGHKIKNYTGCGLFAFARNATFKNIVMTNVTLKIPETTTVWYCAALVSSAEKCKFANITVSGKAVNNGAGIVGYTEACNFTDCTSKVDANVKAQKDVEDPKFAGIAGGDTKSNFKNCKNKGNITLTGKTNGYTTFEAVGIAGLSNKVENCVNTGNLTIKNTAKETPGFDLVLTACGVVHGSEGKVIGCSNTGKISVTNQGGKDTRAEILVCGVVGYTRYGQGVKQCYNKGAVSFSGICPDNESGNSISGVGSGNIMTECYNTGKVTVNTTAGFSYVGGVSHYATKFKNCYNAGTVSLTGKGYVGGVAGRFSDGSCNYNVGKVVAKGKAKAGQIAGYVTMQSSVDNNYYTGSGNKSGGECTSWVPYQSKAKKVSSITFGNCPKLSSKYWTYSGKHKRLILKNNKEA